MSGTHVWRSGYVSQNQTIIESDFWHVIGQALNLPDDQVTARCEHATRNYDPCISSAKHLLWLEMDRG